MDPHILAKRLPFVRVAEPVRFPAGTGAGNRAAPRRPLGSDGAVREVGARSMALPLEIAEVSATGAFIHSDLLLPVGTEVEMTFTLPDGVDQVTAHGRIIRVHENGRRPGMGVSFERVAPEARASLRAYTYWN